MNHYVLITIIANGMQKTRSIDLRVENNIQKHNTIIYVIWQFAYILNFMRVFNLISD